MNNQPIEKRRNNRATLDVHGIFSTIQGEGPFSGTKALFIRLAGCNLQCPNCDTDYTSHRFNATVNELVGHVRDEPLVVITGGEPFRQDISLLCSSLIGIQGVIVQVETNGTLPPPVGLHSEVVVVCSPKTAKINPKLQERVDAYKYVIPNDSSDICAIDGLPLRMLKHSTHGKVARPHNNTVEVYVTPEECQQFKTAHEHGSIQNLVNSVKAHPRYVAQCQLHKYLNIQ